MWAEIVGYPHFSDVLALGFMRRLILLVLFLLALGTISPSATARVMFGPDNQRLEVSKSKIKSGEVITVVGKRFNPDIGIYLSFCKIPASGSQPTPCAPISMERQTNSGYWISSNAPTYSKGLTTPFGENGSFRVRLKIDRQIGNYRCASNECAVTIRADHLRTSDRSQDLFIPIRFTR